MRNHGFALVRQFLTILSRRRPSSLAADRATVRFGGIYPSAAYVGGEPNSTDPKPSVRVSAMQPVRTYKSGHSTAAFGHIRNRDTVTTAGGKVSSGFAGRLVPCKLVASSKGHFRIEDVRGRGARCARDEYEE